MDSTTLFGMALGLQAPWQVNDVSFAAEASNRKELHLHIGFARGSRFPDETGVACPVHDTVERKWQHLNFFEHHCFLHCSVPRIKTKARLIINCKPCNLMYEHLGWRPYESSLAWKFTGKMNSETLVSSHPETT